jgi:hypothetical protein
MDEHDYIEQRVDDQIKWLSSKSGLNQRLFKRFRLAEIVLASAIPVVALLPLNDFSGKIVVATAGAAIAIIAGAVSLWRFQELWIQYRVTTEALKREKYLYLASAPPYGGTDRFGLLVSRVEALLATENASWMALAKAQPSEARMGDAAEADKTPDQSDGDVPSNEKLSR